MSYSAFQSNRGLSSNPNSEIKHAKLCLCKHDDNWWNWSNINTCKRSGLHLQKKVSKKLDCHSYHSNLLKVLEVRRNWSLTCVHVAAWWHSTIRAKSRWDDTIYRCIYTWVQQTHWLIDIKKQWDSDVSNGMETIEFGIKI